MFRRHTCLVLVPIALGVTLWAQAPTVPPPASGPIATEKDVQIAHRAGDILATREAWNQTDHQDCAPTAKTFGIYCALMKAQREVMGSDDHDAAVMDAAREVIDFVAPQAYNARLVNYNNDPKTTFVDIQALFHILENRLRRQMSSTATAPAPASPAAQSTPRAAALPPAPVTRAQVGPWDAMIVQRAERILASPAQWSKADTGDCAPDAKTFSMSCALDKATQEAAGISGGTAGVSGEVGSSIRSDCRFHSAGSGQEGSCGVLFDQVSIIALAHAAAIKTGVWRKDVAPNEVWAGTISGAQYPVFYEAEKLVRVMSTKKYDDYVVDYNNDPSTTFADVQALLRALEDRVVKNGAADLEENVRGDAADDVEIETYANGTGAIRTTSGWFPVTNYFVQGSSPRFQIDLKAEVPPNEVDRQIIQRAAALITSDAVWNRADNRRCPAGAKTVSIYCAEEQATIEVTGGFHHRRPALELVRVIIEERTKDKKYQHRLMDYNNDPMTTLADVKSLFAEALAQIK